MTKNANSADVNATEAPVWTDDMTNELLGVVNEPSPPDTEDATALAEPSAPESEDAPEEPGSIEEQLRWFKKQFGESQNTLGETRRRNEELAARLATVEGRVQESTEPDYNDPEVQQAQMDKFMRVMDPNWERFTKGDSKIDGYAEDRAPLYNLALMFQQQLQAMQADIKNTFSAQTEGQQLAAAGVTDEIVNKLTGNPATAALWSSASVEQKIALAETLRDSVGARGNVPSSQGPPARPAPTRSTMIESAGATYPVSTGTHGNTINDKAHLAMEKGDMKTAGKLIGDLLDEQISQFRRTTPRR